MITGTSTMTKVLLRHEGKRWIVWIVLCTILSASSIALYPNVFPTVQDRMVISQTISGNPAMGLIFGPAWDLTTTDGFNTWRSLTLGGLFAGIAAINAVVRATRGQEDSGQAELLASGVMARPTRLIAALNSAWIGSLAIGVIAALATGALGYVVHNQDGSLAGGTWENWHAAILLCLTFTVTGWFCAGVAAIAAQIASDSQEASNLAMGVLGALFLLRGFAYSVDLGSFAIWANPLSWALETRPATENHWWPLLILALLALALNAVALALQARRDFGQGLIPPKSGPARGHVNSTWSYAFNLTRSTAIVWCIGFVFLGYIIGFFATSFESFLADNPVLLQVISQGSNQADAVKGQFVGMLVTVVGIVASIAGVGVITRLRHEELDDRVEPILATSITRTRLFASYTAVAFTLTACLVAIAGLMLAFLAARSDLGVTFGTVFAQALTSIPCVWAVVAVAAAVVGALPRALPASWLGVIVAFAITFFGQLSNASETVLVISPFHHLPDLISGSQEWTGWWVVCAITCGLLAVGFAGFHRRDIAVT